MFQHLYPVLYNPSNFKYISIPGIIFIYFSIVFNGIVIFIWKSFKSNQYLMTSFVEFTHGKRLFGTYMYINNLKLDSINHTITEVSALQR